MAQNTKTTKIKVDGVVCTNEPLAEIGNPDTALLTDMLHGNEKMQKMMNCMQKSMHDLQTTMHGMEDDNQCMQNKIQDLEDTNRVLQKKNKCLKNKMRGMQKDKQDLRDKYNDCLQKENCGLTGHGAYVPAVCDEEFIHEMIPTFKKQCNDDPIESLNELQDEMFKHQVEFDRIAQRVWSGFKPKKQDNQKYLKMREKEVQRSNKRLRQWVLKDPAAVARLGVRGEWSDFFSNCKHDMLPGI